VLGIFLHRRDVHDAADVDAAVANEHADAGFLAGHIDFCGQFHRLDVRTPCQGQAGTGQTGRGAGFGHRTGMSLGPWKTPQV
jgi:hypothetical protein